LANRDGGNFLDAEMVTGILMSSNLWRKQPWPEVKMIEIKLSQGAKRCSRGGVTSGIKNTPEICRNSWRKLGRQFYRPFNSAFQDENEPCSILIANFVN